jgi:hypothetical protein
VVCKCPNSRAHKVSKAGKIVQPKIWKDARKAVQKKIEAISGSFAKKMKFLAAKKVAASGPKSSQGSKVKPAARVSTVKVSVKKPKLKGG